MTALADATDPRFTADQLVTLAAFESAPTPPEVREAAVVEEVARERRFSETAMRCLDRALGAMNRAIEITTAEGPAVAIEFIADFLNDTDGIDEAVADAAPDDWLTRWQVTPAAAVAAYRAQDGGAEEAVRGADLIAAERQRQVEAEGWTPEHDAQHAGEALALAACCYAVPPQMRKYRNTGAGPVPTLWPWAPGYWKPRADDRVRELVKAGALIAAEIDRLNACAALTPRNTSGEGM